MLFGREYVLGKTVKFNNNFMTGKIYQPISFLLYSLQLFKLQGLQGIPKDTAVSKKLFKDSYNVTSKTTRRYTPAPI